MRQEGLILLRRRGCCVVSACQRNEIDRSANASIERKLPFQLRLEDFEIAMQDVYDLFYDVNTGLLEKGLERLDDFVRPAIMSGFLSDLLTASIAKHSRAHAKQLLQWSSRLARERRLPKRFSKSRQ